MAGEQRLTRLWLGMGLRNFSMHPAHIPGIKQRVLTSEIGVLGPIVERMRRTDDPVRLAGLLDKLNAA
jgi:phosphotransferase system enzyme I (PtsI)